MYALKPRAWWIAASSSSTRAGGPADRGRGDARLGELPLQVVPGLVDAGVRLPELVRVAGVVQRLVELVDADGQLPQVLEQVSALRGASQVGGDILAEAADPLGHLVGEVVEVRLRPGVRVGVGGGGTFWARAAWEARRARPMVQAASRQGQYLIRWTPGGQRRV